VGHLTSLTIIAVGTAIIVFAVVVSHAGRPIRLYRRMAVVTLALSFIPDVALLFVGGPRYSAAAHFMLTVLHVVDAAICVGLLTTLPLAERRSGPWK
jgi:hypothetical protein